MTDAEKKIRSMIRPGKAARIILWSSLLLTALPLGDETVEVVRMKSR